MIPYINDKLNQWGLWAKSGRANLGYPKRAAFMRLVPRESLGATLMICDDEAMSLNRAVQTLDRDLRDVVDLFYVKMRSCDGESIAKALHCHRDTMYARLHRAHLRVMDALHEEELLTGPDSSCRKQAHSGLLHPKQTSKACES